MSLIDDEIKRRKEQMKINKIKESREKINQYTDRELSPRFKKFSSYSGDVLDTGTSKLSSLNRAVVNLRQNQERAEQRRANTLQDIGKNADQRFHAKGIKWTK